eukprot:GHVT01016493.1.p1 GENE.GHVT01016493.1~~GHVT01016493.1.p1  ORF type:complete len:497 (-),score=77.42 GHVT01016493.1:2889-4379(-)
MSAPAPVNESIAKRPRIDPTLASSSESAARPKWTTTSWKTFPVTQDAFATVEPRRMQTVERKLETLPPLVQPAEIDTLLKCLADVQTEKKFILQGGDCAERFLDCCEDSLRPKLQILLQMSVVIAWAGRRPTVRIGRIAGQFAKPRSAPTEEVDGQVVSTFKGDCVNDIDPTKREPDPDRLVQAYFYSSSTLNCIRGLLSAGFADLRKADNWQMDHYFHCAKRRAEYHEMAEQLLNSIQFMDTCGVGFSSGLDSVEFYTSHEALVLPYETAMTRKYNGKFYDTSAHFVWIGERTRQLNGAHVEFCSGIENPVGVKVGPKADPLEIVALCQKLNACNRPGKVVLITRLGASKVKEALPPLIKLVQEAGVSVVWECDPMHGNTETTKDNVKTRHFDKMLAELIDTFEIHAALKSHLGGVHFEMTGDNVTECIGGPQELGEEDLHINYQSYCDPRLNYAQSMEIAFQVARILRNAIPSPWSSPHMRVTNQPERKSSIEL